MSKGLWLDRLVLDFECSRYVRLANQDLNDATLVVQFADDGGENAFGLKRAFQNVRFPRLQMRGYGNQVAHEQ